MTQTFRLTAKQVAANALLAGMAMYLMLFGGSRCVAGDTRLAGYRKTIKELAEDGMPVVVKTSRGFQLVESPFLKGRCKLLRFTLASGRSVEVTPDHRFWNGKRWIKANNLSIGDSLAVQSSEKSPLESNLEFDLSESPVDGRSSKQTLEDFQDYCFSRLRQCDQQLHLVVVCARAYCASLFGALERIHSGLPLISLFSESLVSGIRTLHSSVHEEERSRYGQKLFLRSSKDDFPQTCQPAPESDLGSVRTSALSQGLHQAHRLSHWLSSARRSIAVSADSAVYRFCLFAGLSWDTPLHSGYSLDEIVSITETAEKEYYTLHVPVAEQYFANGILHHNSGKTFLLVRAVCARALKSANSRHAIVRFRFNAVKNSVVFDTFPKVMELCFAGVPYKLDKSNWFVKFPNGSEIWFAGLDDKERTEKILGMEFATIYFNECSQIPWGSIETAITRLAQKCTQLAIGNKPEVELKPRLYFDCNPPSKNHWTYKLFVEKRSPETRELLRNPENYAYMQINPMDNEANVAPGYLDTLRAMSARARKRFLDGEFADANPNALFPEEHIDRWRVTDGSIPDMVRVVIACDPSGADDADNADNDAIGIVAAGLGTDGNAYLLEDLTVKAGPATWGKIVTDAYDRHQADAVVGETNFGGAMVGHVIKTCRPRTNFVKVSASRGKVQRAEPFSALYEQGKVRHVGYFVELEDELAGFSTYGYTGGKSPNRADAHIWALAALFPAIVAGVKKDLDFIPAPAYSPFRK